jgi:hypothetical protein
MTIGLDLLHAGPLFLVSLAITAGALFVTSRNVPQGATHTWGITAAASLIDLIIGILLEGNFSAPSLLWGGTVTLLLVTIPVALGGRRIARLAARGSTGARTYATSLLLGLGVGWVMVPLALYVIAVVIALSNGGAAP